MSASLALPAFGQDQAMFALYGQNEYLVNPAQAGRGGLTAQLAYRRQWAAVANAPETRVFTLQNDPRQNMGLGLRLHSQQAGVFSRTGVQGTYAHQVNFNRRQALRFGLSLGAGQSSVRWDVLTASDYVDPALYNLDNRWQINAGFGAVYANQGLQLGVTFPQLTIFRQQTTATTSAFANLGQVVATATYGWRASETVLVKPAVLARLGANTLPHGVGRFDASLHAEWNDRVWAGALYRHRYGAAASLGFHLGKMSVGYAYEFALGNLGGNTANGTHELSLRLALGNRGQRLARRQERERAREEQEAMSQHPADQLPRLLRN